MNAEFVLNRYKSNEITKHLRQWLADDGHWANGSYLNSPNAKPFLVAIKEFYGIEFKIKNYEEVIWQGNREILTWLLLTIESEE